MCVSSEQALQAVQREAQERYKAAVAAGEEDLPGKIVGICVGKGEAMGMLKGARGVVCVGWKAGEELARTVASCDIMVAPSEVSKRYLVYSSVFSTVDKVARGVRLGAAWLRVLACLLSFSEGSLSGQN